jgi:CO dehydrogenase/acetyl-CoA synthase beta subunit
VFRTAKQCLISWRKELDEEEEEEEEEKEQEKNKEEEDNHHFSSLPLFRKLLLTNYLFQIIDLKRTKGKEITI